MFSGKDLSTLSVDELNKHYQEQGRLIAALREERDLSEKHYKEALSGIEATIKTNSTLIAELKNKIDRHKSTLAPLQKTTASISTAVPTGSIPIPPPPPPPPPGPKAGPGTPKAPDPIKAAVTTDPRAALLEAIRERQNKKDSESASTTSASNNTDMRSDSSNTPIDSSMSSSTTTSPRNSSDDDDDWESDPDESTPPPPPDVQQLKAALQETFKINPQSEPTKSTITSDPNKEINRLKKDILSRDNLIHKMTGEIKDFHAKKSPAIIKGFQAHQTEQLIIIKALEKQEKMLADLEAKYIETTKKKIIPTSPISEIPPAPPSPPAFGTMPPPPPPPPPPAFGAIPPAPKKTETSTADTLIKQESKKSTDIPTNTSSDTTQEHLGQLQAALAKRHAAMKGESLEDEPLQKTPEEMRLEREKAAQTLKDAQAQREQDLLAEKEASKVASEKRAAILKTLPQTLGITLDLQADLIAIDKITQKQTHDLERLKKEQVSLASFDPLLETMALELEALSKKQATEALAPASVVEQPVLPESVTQEPTLVSPVLVEPALPEPVTQEPAPSGEFSSVPTNRPTQTSIANRLTIVQELFDSPTADLPTTPATADDSLATHEEKILETPAEFTSAAESQATPQAFSSIFEQHKTFKEDYEALEKISFAQKVHVHNHLREDQIKLLDLIEETLVEDQTLTDEERAKIFYSVLSLTKENLSREFRWTDPLGLKEGRLEHVIQETIGLLSKIFPNMKPFTNKQQLNALLAEKGFQHLEPHVNKLLEPHGFLKAAKAFIKHGFSIFHKPNPNP